jgi:hypothetical protein
MVIELPDILLEANEGLPPGRELFLDLVHMTARGIQLAMAAVAERVLPLLGGPTLSRAQILGYPFDAEPRALAQGHFIAALANGGMENAEVVRYYAAAAVRYDSEMAPVMVRVIRMMLGRTPQTYYEAYAYVAEASRRYPGLKYVLYMRPVVAPHALYAELARALATAAERIVPGVIDECESLLRHTMLNEVGPTSLLSCSTQHAGSTTGARDRFVTWHRQTPSFLRFFTARSVFLVPCGRPQDLLVELTARRGDGNGVLADQ